MVECYGLQNIVMRPIRVAGTYIKRLALFICISECGPTGFALKSSFQSPRNLKCPQNSGSW